MKPGERLAQWRKERKVSLRALEQAAGVHRSTIVRWESGQTTPRRHEWDAVVRALGFEGVDLVRAKQTLDGESGSTFVKLETLPVGIPVDIPRGPMLRTLRLRAGKSLDEVAAATGVNPSTVSRWENSAGWPDRDQLQTVCHLCGAQAEEAAWLLAGPSESTYEGSVEAFLSLQVFSLPETLFDLVETARMQLLQKLAVADPTRMAQWEQVTTRHAMRLSYKERHREAVTLADRARAKLRPAPSSWQSAHFAIINASAEASKGQKSIYLAAEIVEDALTTCEDPDYRHWLKGEVALHLSVAGEHDLAVATAEESVEMALDRGYPEYHCRRHDVAQVMIRAGRYHEAKEILKLSPRGEIGPLEQALESILEGDATRGLGQVEEARAHYERAKTMLGDLLARPLLVMVAEKQDELESEAG